MKKYLLRGFGNHCIVLGALLAILAFASAESAVVAQSTTPSCGNECDSITNRCQDATEPICIGLGPCQNTGSCSSNCKCRISAGTQHCKCKDT